MQPSIVIIGSGLAGYNLAREIRQRDKTISITMITRDAGEFYSKPMLSTALSMNKTPDMLRSMNAEKMAAQYHMEILTHTHVEKIIPETNTLIIKKNDGESSLHYSTLVFCVGAESHSPKLEGDAAHDILQVNDIDQYATFREKIANKKNITLLGAGLVGCEFANDLTLAGHIVNIIEPAQTPMASLLPAPVGQALKDALEQQGTHWYLGRTAASIHYHQHQYHITLDDQSSLTTDMVFSAIGLKPRTTLAQQAGIQTQRGIIVDKLLRTNIDNIYALGDCAEINGLVLPYIAPIMQCAKALAATLTGEATELSLPAMAVVVKTSCYPIVICRPPFAVDATWQFEEADGMLRGYFKDKADKLYGFVLTKDAIKERTTLTQSLEHWL